MLTVPLSVSFSVCLQEIVLVSVDKEASKCAIRPEGIKEESILLWVEDLQPHLVRPLQVENSGTRGHVMVACVCIESLDLVLSIMDQANGEVFICQSDVICKVVDAGNGTDKLPAAGVVVIPFIEQDPAEADGQSLFRVALCHSDGEGGSRCAATVAAARSSFLASVPRFSFGSLFSSDPWCPPRSLQASWSSFTYDTLTAFLTLPSWVPRPPLVTWQQMQCVGSFLFF